MSKILVTGGSGYIGQHFCKKLKETTDHYVIVVDNLSIGNVATIYCDEHYILNVSRCDQVFKDHQDIDAVVHFAGSCDVAESISNPSKYFRNNTLETLELLDLLCENGVYNLIFSSTCTLYGNVSPNDRLCEDLTLRPTNTYGLSKMFSEHMIHEYSEVYSFNSVILRYFNVAGTSDDRKIGYNLKDVKLIPSIIRSVANSEELKVYTSGMITLSDDNTCIRDYVHVEDLVEAHLIVLERDLLNTDTTSHGKCDFYNIGTGKGYSTLQVIEEAEKLLGVKVKKRMCGVRLGDPISLVAAPDKFRQKYEWIPSRPMRKIIESAFDWYQLQKDTLGQKDKL